MVPLSLIEKDKILNLAYCKGYVTDGSTEMNDSYNVIIGKKGEVRPCNEFNPRGEDHDIGAGIVVQQGFCNNMKNINFASIPDYLSEDDLNDALDNGDCNNEIEGGGGERDSLYLEDLSTFNDDNELINDLKLINSRTLKDRSTVRNYIVKLLSQVKSRGDDCFVKGAFVIHDPDYKLFELLCSNMDDEIKFKSWKSHMKYNKQNSNIDYQNMSNWLRKLEYHIKNRDKKFKYKFNGPCEVWIQPLGHTCPNCQEPVTYKNIKWYPFPGNNGENHIYLKLEGFPTMDLLHLKQWLKRHVIKRATNLFNKEESSSKCKNTTFREDCETEDNCKYNDPDIDLDILKLNPNSDETYDRRGDELYVSAEINNNLLSSRGGRKAKRTRKMKGTRKTKRTRKTRRKLGTRKTRRK